MNGLNVIFTLSVLTFTGVFSGAPIWGQVKNDPPPAPGLPVTEVADYYSDIRETPWFNNEAIRKHIVLSDLQYKQLNTDYRRAWLRFNDGLRRLDPALTESERISAREALRYAFHRDLARSADLVLTDPVARQRFHQLYLQHRGPGALSDPVIQDRLELTAEQRARYRELDHDWNQRMAGWHRDYNDDSASVLKRFNSNRTEIQEGLESAMTRKQQETWHSLTGEPYEMPPEAYFQDSMKQKALTR